MQVPLLDLKPQYRSLRDEIRAAIDRVCDGQHFILGPTVRRLESAIAGYCGTAHGVGMSSGTDALLAALMALQIGSGDEVITSPYTFFATAGTIARVGARPIFCDIDPHTFNIDAASIESFIAQHCERRDGRLVNRRTGGTVRAVMPVHLYGQLADMPRIMEIARHHDLRVIEDAAQAIGARDAAGRVACSYGDVGCLSFFPTKNLGAFGDAGMCVTNDAALAARLAMVRVHGMEPKYYHHVVGGNFRLDELQAAVLEVKLPRLDAWSEARRRNAAIYDRAFGRAQLGGAVTPPPAAADNAFHIYNQYVIRAQDRNALRAFLSSREIGTEIYYPLALHQQACFAYLGHVAGEFPHSEQAASETLALPIYPELEAPQLEYVVASIVEFYRGARARS